MFDTTTLIGSIALLSAGMLAAWLLVMRTGNGGWSDVIWTFSVGASGVWAALGPGGAGTRASVAAALVAAWSLRLGLHLVRRVSSHAEDFRYTRLRSDWGPAYRTKMLAFLQLQAAFAVPLVLAVHVAATRPGPFPDAADLIGLVIIAVAVAGEAIADRQLAAFAASGKAHGNVLDSGLWGWSRHPNFFFEWLAWCAWAVIAIGPHLALWPGALALLAPITMYWLLVHVTGIPPIEERMLATRGDAFRAYQRRVPVFFPRPPQLASR